MVVLAALAGVALLVTKLGKSSMEIKNESIVSNDYNDLVRESHFLISNLKACKVSLAGTLFVPSLKPESIPNLELWTADSKGLNRVKKKFFRSEKFNSLQIEDVSLIIDPTSPIVSSVDIQHSTGTLKISLMKTKSKNPPNDIEQTIDLNYMVNPTTRKAEIIDCESSIDSKENALVWCGTIQNPCGTESIQVVGIGKYVEGKFTGIFQPTTMIDAKICNAAVNHPASFSKCIKATE